MKTKHTVLAILFLTLSAYMGFSQSIQSIDPNRGRLNETLPVVISGMNTHFASGSSTVQFFYQGSPTNKIQVKGIQSLSNTDLGVLMHIQGSSTLGAYTYKVSNSTDGLMPGNGLFYVGPDTGSASLISMAPNSTQPGNRIFVNLMGINTHFLQGSSTLNGYFMQQGTSTTDIQVASISALDDTHLMAEVQVASAAAGSYDFSLTNLLDGQLNLQDALFIDLSSPRIVSITPDNANPGQTLTVTLTGSLSHFTQGSPTITLFHQGSPTFSILTGNYLIQNDCNMTAEFSIMHNAPFGEYDVVYSNNMEVLARMGGFRVNPPIGILEKTEGQTISVYPNPARNQVTISSEKHLITRVEIMDLQGRLIHSENPVETPELTFNVDEFVLQNNYVLLRIYTTGGVLIKQLLLQQ